MNRVDQVLSQGTLSDLTRLEQRAEQLVNKQGALCGQLTALQALQARIVHLRARRDQLRDDGARPVSGPMSLIGEKSGETKSEALRELQLKKYRLEEKKAAYRLLGRSMTVVDRRTVRLCLDTSYEGEFSTPSYVEMNLGATAPAVTRHTLPAFVPLHAANKVLKAGGPGAFADSVQQYLQARHIRAGFASAVQEQHRAALAEDVQTTPSGDWLKISLTSVPQCGGATIELQLKYDDLTTWLPTRVKVTIQDSDSEEDARRDKSEAEDIAELLKTCDLPSAISALLGQ